MTRMLVVVGTVSGGVLSTEVAVPTDGQEPRWKCGRCLLRKDEVDGCDCGYPLSAADGPFPFTVGVWTEGFHHGCTCWSCAGGLGDQHGAVVATVEVKEPSHATGYQHKEHHHLFCCQVDTLGWHTPVGEVTWLDVPTPMERPSGKPSGYAAWGNVNEGPPQRSWWWADLPVEAHR